MDVTRFGRFKLPELSIRRLLSGSKARAREIPHTLFWRWDPFAHENRERIKRYQGRHRGERCFIVANGPSLKKTDLRLLANEITFGMNRIYLSFEETGFCPTYYVAVNELVLEQFAGDIARLKMPKFLNWNCRSHFDTRDPVLVFLKPKLVLKDTFQTDATNPMVFGASVTFATLQLAFYMGFQKVVLVGLDHKYAERGLPNQTEVRTTTRDESHFHPNYFPKGIRWQLPDLLRSEIDFHVAREVYEEDGREILDATIGGHCPVFQKADYLSLFD